MQLDKKELIRIIKQKITVLFNQKSYNSLTTEFEFNLYSHQLNSSKKRSKAITFKISCRLQ